MTDKQNFEIKETLTYGHKLLTGKQTKYEFVKQDFEKDIDVPSKQKIMYDYNAKDCEQCGSDSVCCYCKNLTYYKLEEQLKRAENQIVELNKMVEAKEQECERLKKTVDDLLHKPEIQDKILWKIDNEALLGSKDAWIYKLEKTIAEIKEIAESEMDSKEFMAVQCMLNGSVDNKNKVFKQILQKISEVMPNEKV